MASLREEAARLAADLAEAAGEADQLRRLPDRTWKQLVETGFVRALQPSRWGGGEVHLTEFVDAIAEIARASASAGWVAGVIGVHPWQLALFPEEAQDEMWGEDPARMHSSSYNPTGHAESVDGGFRLQGRWSFSSGCDHCQRVVLGAVCGMADAGIGKPVPDFRSFLLHEGQYRIEDTWHVSGLKGTGSKDIVVEDAFVPDHRTQSHMAYVSGEPLPGQAVNSGPLYRLPWSVVFNMAVAAAVLGMARGFTDTWIDETRHRVIGGGDRVADDPFTQHRVAEDVWLLDTAMTKMHADIDEMWDMANAGTFPTMADRARWRWSMNRTCELAGDAVVDLFHAASGRTIYLDHPLQRRFQDLQGALGHAFLLPEPVAKAYGGALLGTDRPTFVL